ncbi:MAG TPA: dihydrodipicolinate synthase family protein [Clostridiaceae bacterium]|nr:dihydrodipicolinate synthase family protein [Clostridiaceae bacterium]
MFDMTNLQGVFAPIVTPFNEDEEILFDDIAYNIDVYNNTKLRGYMPLGSNGEFQGLTDEESIKVLKIVCKHKKKDKIIVGGCGRESMYKTVEFIKMVADYGLDLAFILPPHYFLSKMTEDVLSEYYIKVADKSPIPIVIYNAPKFSAGLNLSPKLISELAKHPNIIAIKNSSDTPNLEYTKKISGLEFSVIAGNIKTFYQGLCDGAIGGVLSTASVFPEYCCSLYEYFRAGDLDEAKKLHSFLHNLSMNTVGPLGVSGVKAGMTLRGLKGGNVRLPLMNATADEFNNIKDWFEKEGIKPLKWNYA